MADQQSNEKGSFKFSDPVEEKPGEKSNGKRKEPPKPVAGDSSESVERRLNLTTIKRKRVAVGSLIAVKEDGDMDIVTAIGVPTKNGKVQEYNIQIDGESTKGKVRPEQDFIQDYDVVYRTTTPKTLEKGYISPDRLSQGSQEIKRTKVKKKSHRDPSQRLNPNEGESAVKFTDEMDTDEKGEDTDSDSPIGETDKLAEETKKI